MMMRPGFLPRACRQTPWPQVRDRDSPSRRPHPPGPLVTPGKAPSLCTSTVVPRRSGQRRPCSTVQGHTYKSSFWPLGVLPGLPEGPRAARCTGTCPSEGQRASPVPGLQSCPPPAAHAPGSQQPHQPSQPLSLLSPPARPPSTPSLLPALLLHYHGLPPDGHVVPPKPIGMPFPTHWAWCRIPRSGSLGWTGARSGCPLCICKQIRCPPPGA